MTAPACGSVTPHDPTSVVGRSALRAVLATPSLAGLCVAHEHGGVVLLSDESAIAVAEVYSADDEALATAIVAAVHSLPEAMERIEVLEAEVTRLRALVPPRRCDSIDDVGGQCRSNAGHAGHHGSDDASIQWTDDTPQHGPRHRAGKEGA